MSEAGAAGGGPPLAAAALLAATGLAALPFVAALLARLPRRRPVFFARWGFSHALLVALGAFLSLNLGVAALSGRVPDGGKLGVLESLWATMIGEGGGVALVLVLARRLQPEGLGALGLARGGIPRACLAGVLAWVLLLPAILGVSGLWQPVAVRLGFDPGPQDVLRGIGELSGADALHAFVLAALVAPFLEETLFRGFLQPLLVQNLRERGGIAATSALFAALHGDGMAFAPLFCLSMLLGYVQLRTHRLAAAWLVHGLHNATMLLIVFLLPDWLDLPGPNP